MVRINHIWLVEMTHGLFSTDMATSYEHVFHPVDSHTIHETPSAYVSKICVSSTSNDPHIIAVPGSGCQSRCRYNVCSNRANGAGPLQHEKSQRLSETHHRH